MISIHNCSLNQIHPNEVLDGVFSAEKGLLLPWAHREAEDPVRGEEGRCLAEPALVEPRLGLNAV